MRQRQARPGELLRLLAARVYSRRTIERLIDPIVADLQYETAAVPPGSPFRAEVVRWRGYVALWRAILVHAALHGWRLTSAGAALAARYRGRLAWRTGVALLIVSTLLSLQPLLTSRLPFGVTVYGLVAAMTAALPLALFFAAVLSFGGRRLKARAHASAALHATVGLALVVAAVGLLAGARVQPAANQQYRERAFAWFTAQMSSAERATVTTRLAPWREMTLAELTHGITRARATGDSTLAHRLRIEWHVRVALPVATIVLAVLGFALGLHGGATRKGAAVRWAAAGVIAASFLTLLSHASRTSATSSAAVGLVWLGHALCGVLAAVLLAASWLGRTRVHASPADLKRAS